MELRKFKVGSGLFCVVVVVVMAVVEKVCR